MTALKAAAVLFVLAWMVFAWIQIGRDQKRIKRLKGQLAVAIAEAKFFQDVANTEITVLYRDVVLVTGKFVTLHMIGKYSRQDGGWTESVLTPPDALVRYRIRIPEPVTDGQ